MYVVIHAYTMCVHGMKVCSLLLSVCNTWCGCMCMVYDAWCACVQFTVILPVIRGCTWCECVLSYCIYYMVCMCVVYCYLSIIHGVDVHGVNVCSLLLPGFLLIALHTAMVYINIVDIST